MTVNRSVEYVNGNSWLPRDEGIKIGEFIKALYIEMLFTNVGLYISLSDFFHWNNSLSREVATQVKEPQPTSVSLKESHSIYREQDQNVIEHSNCSQGTLPEILPLERLEGIKIWEKTVYLFSV